MRPFLFSWKFFNISGRHRTYFYPPVVLQTEVTALQTQRGLGIFGQKLAPSDSLVQRFLWKNRKNGIFEALFQQVNDIVQMWDMAHSICLIKLYQIKMRKNFDFLFLTTLKTVKKIIKSSFKSKNLRTRHSLLPW